LIKKFIVNFIIIVLLVSIKYSFFSFKQYTFFYNIIPDLVLIFTVFNGIFFGSYFGMIFGAFAGFTLDMCYINLVGMNLLIYAAIGFLVIIIEKKIDIENFILAGIIIFIYFIIKSVLYLIFGTLYEPSEVIGYFQNYFIWQLLFTILFSIPVFLLYKKVVKKNKETDRNFRLR
jgi:rod shape-determining protein MreD